VPDLVLGIDGGKPTWQIFGRAAGVWDESPDNRLFIGTSSLVTYITTLSGRLIGQFGGYGSGPGEFLVPTGNFWIEEDQEIWIYDSRLIRLTRFLADGRLIGTLSCEEQAKHWQSLVHLRDKRFLGSRTEYENGEFYTRYGILDDQFNWDRTVISRLNRPTATYSPRDGLEIPIPYQPGCWVIAFPDGRFVHGRADIGRLEYYSVDGEALFWVEDCWEFPRVTQDDRNRWLDRIESRRPEELPAARSARLPDRHGAFGWAVTDESGRLWLTRAKPTYSSENNREYVYDFFGPDGIWLGTQVLTFPPNQISSKA